MSDLLTISSILVAKMGTQSMCIIIPIESKTSGENKTIDTPVLLDTGARGNFMNKSYATWNKLLLYPLNTPITPRNVDGSLNQEGEITHYTWVRAKMDGRTSLVQLLITNLRNQDSSLDYHGSRNIIPRLNGTQDKSSSLKQPQWTTSHTDMPTRNINRKSKTRPWLQFPNWRHV